ncbi:pyridoxamine 5'-phosphate oxidase family protein [Herbaspirillum sp. GCM10030257]|uniref:pyridoxamine 5'-phosphate oxidase family protein n=1 Tax=Herbaspirillum sp. GCM10030257 TaxID=3273393 RepID=UPI00361AA3FB
MDTARSPQALNPEPFHRGEIDAQERAGVRAQMERVGAVVLRNYMPDQHRELFNKLPTLLLGGADANAQVWASIIWGKPGFIASPDATTLRVGARLDDDDPLAAMVKPGAGFGALGLEFDTRRRNRANGIVTQVDELGFTFSVQQSFGNCPKYIQTRNLATREPGGRDARLVSGTGALPPDAVALVRRSDTFFIATMADASAGKAHGADVSHRGGKPGFVNVGTEGELIWPDFVGNNFFNTIGNILADGRAGLLFIDFEYGDLLQVTGNASVLWDEEEVSRFEGARRLLRFQPERYVLRKNAFPLRWVLREQSPYLEPTGMWN